MNTISQTKTRCIKPNSLKKPRILDHKSTVVQLRSAGVVVAMSISRASFPNRPRLEVAWHRFSSLVSKTVLHEACACHAVGNEKKEDFSSTKVTVNLKVNYLLGTLLKGMKSPENDYISTCKVFICGRTRVYFCQGALEHLEVLRQKKLEDSAIYIQSSYRRHVGIKAQT